MPLNWNKINQEDSSVSGYDSIHEDDIPQIQSPIFSKILTDPAITPKEAKIKTSLHGTPILIPDVIDQNLHKLSLIESQEIWLFVPKPHKIQNADQIGSILKNIEKVKRILTNSSGWNILLSKKDDAKDFILKGFKKNKFTLKFYVSTKNYESNQYATSTRKGSTQNFDDLKVFKSPEKFRKLHNEEPNSKKKIKYQEKVSNKIPPRDKSKHKSLNKKIEEKNDQSLGQQKNHFFQVTIPAKSALEEKQSNEFSVLEKNQLEKYQFGNPTQEKGQVEVSEKQENQNEEIFEKEISSPEQQADEDYDSEEILERMKRAIKRKNKKMNKKKVGSKAVDSIDKNNPFSLLS